MYRVFGKVGDRAYQQLDGWTNLQDGDMQWTTLAKAREVANVFVNKDSSRREAIIVADRVWYIRNSAVT